MKKTLVAIMDKNGNYVESFKAKDGKVLAYRAECTKNFERALTANWDAIKDDDENTRRLKSWAEAVEGKLVLIEVDYKVTELESGEEREEYKEQPKKDIGDAILQAMGILEKEFNREDEEEDDD